MIKKVTEQDKITTIEFDNYLIMMPREEWEQEYKEQYLNDKRAFYENLKMQIKNKE